jgi:hypothetical protein
MAQSVVAVVRRLWAAPLTHRKHADLWEDQERPTEKVEVDPKTSEKLTPHFPVFVRLHLVVSCILVSHAEDADW